MESGLEESASVFVWVCATLEKLLNKGHTGLWVGIIGQGQIRTNDSSG